MLNLGYSMRSRGNARSKTNPIAGCSLAAALLLTLAGCSDGTSPPLTPGAGITPSVTPTSTSPITTSTSPAVGTDTTSTDTSPAVPEPVITPTEGYAINETFDAWAGKGGRDFQDTKGDSASYADHNTVKNIDGHDCLWVHSKAVDNNGYGFSVEVQMNLDAQTDMSTEDWELSYDVYIPAATMELGANMQFGLYRTSDNTPIYSVWYSGSLMADQWVTLTTPINTVDALISYSGFENNPDDWIFDAVRIQAIINGTGAAVGSEISFCIDNLKARQVDPEEQEALEEAERIAKPTPYAVWIDGQALPVERLGKYELPVNYLRYTYPGQPLEIKIASAVGLADYRLSPISDAVPTKVGVNMLELDVSEPGYYILDVPGQERLLLFIDPPEVDAPAATDATVTNVADLGVDNTGMTDNTALLQGAIDAASGAEKNIVYVPPGVYNTQPLFMRDNMTLYLADGALLQNVKDQADLITLPDGLTVIEGSADALILFKGVTGAKLKGRGTLDGNGRKLKGFGRKMFLVKLEDSKDIEIDGIIARDSAFWNTLIYRSDNVQITNYKVINNQLVGEWNETDGVDFNNCTNSALTNAFLYTGDDCMAVKSDDIPDETPVDGILDPTTGAYQSVSNIVHSNIVCHSASSGCKVGTKTFGPTMSGIQYKDVDIVQAERGLVIDAVDTATIDQTLFQDIRMESINGRLVDFNMDPEAITWRTNPGTCTVTNTTVSNVQSAVSKDVAVKGNVHDWDEADPFFGNEYFIDGVVFDNFTVAGTPIDSLESTAVVFDVNTYAKNITFQTSVDTGSTDDSSGSDTGVGTGTASESGVSTAPSSDTSTDTGAPDTGTPGEMVWLPSWATTNQRTEDKNEPPPLSGRTLRQFVWPSYSGGEIRVQLSNQRGELPVEIAKVHVAKALPLGAAEIDSTTDVELTWGGEVAVTIAPGETAWSDPITFDLVEMTPVAITMFFTTAPLDVTGHPGSRTTSYIGEGDLVAEPSFTGETRDRWYFIEAIEVMAPEDAYAIAILGDSITDGYGILNKFARWPDFFNRSVNLDAALADSRSVLNFGMGGNCLTAPGENDDMDSGLVRFERDVLGRKDKIRWLIVFIGVNDMIYCGASAETITAAYQDIIDRSHAEGIAVYGVTITPFESHTQGDPLAVREAVNTWITTSNAFDAVLDFSTVVADPRKLSQLNPPLSNDGLHPNEAGYEALADSVDPSLFYTTLPAPVQ